MPWKLTGVFLAPELALPARFGNRHGTTSRYGQGCRCDICRTMKAIIHRRGTYVRKATPAHQKRAHGIVERAVRDGRIFVPEECENCGARPRRRADGDRSLEAHHDDYTKPLDVRWLCKPCHSVADRVNRSRRPHHSGEGAGASDRRRYSNARAA